MIFLKWTENNQMTVEKKGAKMNIKKIVADMSLRQKLAQLSQYTCDFILKDAEGMITGPAAAFNLTAEDVASIGTVLGACGAELTNKIQDTHLAEDPHKIPLLLMADIIHGYKTVYPIPLGMGATFDEDIVEECSRMAAKEAAIGGIHVTFSPMVDLVRDARWGRCMESTGEDAYLNSKMAAAQVRGYQGNFESKHNIACCVKHFAAYGAAEAGRDYNSVDMSEHKLREYYLPAYKAAIDAGCELVMTAFNTLNGIPSAGNKWLVNDILREEWGFDKIVISDYNSFREMIEHGYCADGREAAEKAVKAGNDIEMMSNTYITCMESLVADGTVSEELIDKAVLRVLKLKEKLGLFDDPARGASIEDEKTVFLCEEHRAIARKAAEKSAVLLKNNDVLPFSKSIKKIVVIGPYANKGMNGAWFGMGSEAESMTVFEGVKKLLPDCEVLYLAGCKAGFAEKAENSYDLIEEAAEAARKADAVILCIGEDSFESGEAFSKTSISIPDAQVELVKAVTSVNRNNVAAIFCGRPLVLTDIEPYLSAMAVMWQPGTEGGSACANLFFGECDFEGRLPMSFPRSVGQCPVFYNYLKTGRPQETPNGETPYRTRYLDCLNTPLYSFGYGLSYNEFEISDIALSSDKMNSDDSLIATVKVKNVGQRKGKTLIQLYISDVFASVARPVKELREYKRIELMPGEESDVSFEISEEMLRFNTVSGEFTSEKGLFKAYIGADSDTENCAEFFLI